MPARSLESGQTTMHHTSKIFTSRKNWWDYISIGSSFSKKASKHPGLNQFCFICIASKKGYPNPLMWYTDYASRKHDATARTYKVRVVIHAEILRSALNKQVYIVQNIIATFFTTSLLWHLERFQQGRFNLREHPQILDAESDGRIMVTLGTNNGILEISSLFSALPSDL